jgi:hypothetical protein
MRSRKRAASSGDETPKPRTLADCEGGEEGEERGWGMRARRRACKKKRRLEERGAWTGRDST